MPGPENITAEKIQAMRLHALSNFVNLFFEIIMVLALKTGAVLNGTIINYLRFANDVAATAENQDDLQMIVDDIVIDSSKMEMKVNIEYTEVQCIGPHISK